MSALEATAVVIVGAFVAAGIGVVVALLIKKFGTYSDE